MSLQDDIMCEQELAESFDNMGEAAWRNIYEKD